MNIQEACKLTGVSKDMIRHYEKLGLIHPKRCSRNQYRVFEQEDLDKIVMIKGYSNLGLELKQLAELFYHNDMQAITEQLKLKIEESRMIQQHIAAKIEMSKNILSYFEQYQRNDWGEIVTMKPRYLISRDRQELSQFQLLCSKVSATPCIYHYYYRIMGKTSEDLKSMQVHDAGILIYPPLPFGIEHSEEFVSVYVYKTVIRTLHGQYVNRQQLLPHLERIEQLGYETDGDILLYQLSENKSEEEYSDVVCAEFQIKKK